MLGWVHWKKFVGISGLPRHNFSASYLYFLNSYSKACIACWLCKILLPTDANIFMIHIGITRIQTFSFSYVNAEALFILFAVCSTDRF